jgi:2-dehydropantoate 2-reductase
LWNAAWGGLSTLARQPVSVLLEDENLEYSASVARKIMLEVVSTARACGYDEKALPASSIDQVFNLTYSQAPSILPKDTKPNLGKDFKPSLLIDLEANRGMELTPIVGNVVKKAKLHNVDTPRLEIILAALRPSLMNVVKAKSQL